LNKLLKLHLTICFRCFVHRSKMSSLTCFFSVFNVLRAGLRQPTRL